MAAVLPPTSQPLVTPSISEPRRNQRIRIVEERWNCLRHGDGQGYQQRKWQQFSLLPHSRWQHPLFPSHDGTNGAELWKSDGTASGTVMVKDINSGSGSSSPSTSQPLATPSISKPRRNQRIRIVEERRNCLRHGDGQGYQQRK